MKPSLFILNLLLSSTVVYAESDIPSPIDNSYSHTQDGIRGQLKAREFAIIAAGLSGKITSFPVIHGQRVKKGQKLVTFNCRMEAAEKAVSIAKLGAAQSKLSTNIELQQYNNISHLEVSLSKAEVAIQKAELRRSRAILSECRIVAPFAGIIVEKFAQAHQYIREGEPLLELVNTSKLDIEMVIPSRLLTKLATNNTFTIKFDEIDAAVDAKVTRNMGVIDPVSQTIRVIGKLMKPLKQLLPGMSGEVSFKQKVTTQSVSDSNGAN